MDLPQPDSPARPNTTRHDVKTDRIDGAHVAALGDVVDAELAHGQQGLLRLHAVFS